MKEIICSVCQTPKIIKTNQKTCSYRCGSIRRVTNRKRILLCVICNNEYVAKSTNNKYCSRKCYTIKYKNQDIEHYYKLRRTYDKTKNRIIQKKLYNQTPKRREYCKKYQQTHYKKKYTNNSNIRIRQSVSSSIRHRLQRYNTKKKNSYIHYVGCDVPTLKKYLESQFQEGMTWENYGEWHIDHIQPCASFDLSNEEEQKKCFHYTNLQPLWKKDNLLKSSYWKGTKHIYKSTQLSS